MARIAGVDIPDNRRIELGLTMIYGIGPTAASKILKQVHLEGNPKIGDIEDSQLQQIREIVDQDHTVEGDLRREVNMNIRRLIDIGTYRGVRHRTGLPVRGQRTKTNARGRKGGKRTIANKKKVIKK
tara:strand:+ start:189 stop:569 length:381 start_codon:yes stop_codon:yes gene_type:complete